MPRSQSSYRAALRLLAASALLAVTAGCGSSADVTGKVTYKGAPLTGGSITIVASDGTVHSTGLNADGTFSLPTVPTGPAQVAVVGANPAAGTKPPPADRGGAGNSGASGRGAPSENPDAAAPVAAPAPAGPVLPAQYGDPKTSGLTTTIKAGQPVNVDLK